jgi:hypothetical protein
VTFFFDNNHSPKIPKILKENGVDARHMQEVFGRGLEDVEWIPEIGKRGWVVITGDLHIKTKKAEKKVFEEANLITFFVTKKYNNAHALKRIAWILNQWEAIEAVAAEAQPGDCFDVPFKGKVKKQEAK